MDSPFLDLPHKQGIRPWVVPQLGMLYCQWVVEMVCIVCSTHLVVDSSNSAYILYVHIVHKFCVLAPVVYIHNNNCTPIKDILL